MWDTAFKVVIWIVAGYLAGGFVTAWKWMIEARIKCVDDRNKAWAEYLSSIQGIVSFTILSTLFWLPVILSHAINRRRKKKGSRNKRAMSWAQSFQKAIDLYQQLQAWRRNDIE